MRWLVGECWRRVVEPAIDAAPAVASQADVQQWLRQIQDEWLQEPDWEDFSGRTPAEVIRCERQRIPMAASAGEAVIDDDCPLCQMLGEGVGPMFWHLDGCNMDDDFPFAIYHRTRQEWEEEQRRDRESQHTFEEERNCEQAVLENELPGREPAGGPSIWTRSIVNTELGDAGPWVTLFGIGCRVAELMTDLKTPPGAEAFAESFSRSFGNLRAAMRDPSSSLLKPVVDRFCQELDAAAEARPDLTMKCSDLERQLRGFATMASGGDEDLPF